MPIVLPPKKFTQPQLFACLVLKTFFQTDYRGVVVFLNDKRLHVEDDIGEIFKDTRNGCEFMLSAVNTDLRNSTSHQA